jgi:hypothetical protein
MAAGGNKKRSVSAERVRSFLVGWRKGLNREDAGDAKKGVGGEIVYHE